MAEALPFDDRGTFPVEGTVWAEVTPRFPARIDPDGRSLPRKVVRLRSTRSDTEWLVVEAVDRRLLIRRPWTAVYTPRGRALVPGYAEIHAFSQAGELIEWLEVRADSREECPCRRLLQVLDPERDADFPVD
jgi:hypothetical protein